MKSKEVWAFNDCKDLQPGTVKDIDCYLLGYDRAREEIADFIYKKNGDAKAFTRAAITEIGEEEV